MSKLTITQTIIALAVVFAIGILLLLISLILRNRTNTKSSLTRLPFVLGACTTIVSGVLGIVLFTQVQAAKPHGLYSLDIEVTKLSEGIAHSPIDQSANFDPDEPHTNTIAVLYRFTCPDCEAIYEQFKAQLDSLPYDTYWISSRSTNGRKLLDLYGVNEVPTLIVFDANGRVSVSKAFTYNDAGDTILDQSAVDIALRTLDSSQLAESNEE